MSHFITARTFDWIFTCGRWLRCLAAALFCMATSARAVITIPAPGSTLGSSATFTWTPGAGRYFLYVGTTGVGSSNVVAHGPLSNATLSQQVTGIPNQPINVRLWEETGVNTNSYWVYDYIYNGDLDEDGILDVIDPNPGVANPKVVHGGPDHTFTLLGSGRVASLEYPSLFSATNASMSSAQMRQITNIIFTYLNDDFDFILVASNQASAPAGASYVGIHFAVRNDISGLGKPIYTNAGSFGSSGRLQSAIHLIDKSNLRGGPSLHEMAHRWANSMVSVPTTVGGHWGYSSIGGQLGGWKPGSLESLGGGAYRAQNPRTGSFASFGSFANGGNGLPYSEFELYVMGLIPPAEVLNDIVIANGFQWTNSSEGRFTATSLTTRTMAQVIATDGARVPAHTTSQRDFRVLYLLLSSGPLSTEDWRSADKDVYDFALEGSDGSSSYNFWEATGGRASVTMDGLLGSQKATGPLVVKNFTRDPAAVNPVAVTVFSRVGYNYTLNYAPNLDGNWNPLTPVPGIGADLVLTHNPGTSPRMFYMVQEDPELIAAFAGLTDEAHASEEWCPCVSCPDSSRSLLHFPLIPPVHPSP